MLCFALHDNPDEIAAAMVLNSLNNLVLSECRASMTVQSCGTQSMCIEHKGVRLWNCDDTSEADQIEFAQFTLAAYSSTAPASALTYGYLWFDYELDLYSPSLVAPNAATVAKPPPIQTENGDTDDGASEMTTLAVKSGLVKTGAPKASSDSKESVPEIGAGANPANGPPPLSAPLRPDHFLKPLGSTKASPLRGPASK